MLFKIIEKFGSHSGERWSRYVNWRKFEFSSFDSVDGMLRSDLFEPETQEDWDNCVNADFKLNLITNLEYAQRVLSRYENADLIGVKPEVKTAQNASSDLLGYDVIDCYCDVSLLTNWGNEGIEFINSKLQSNGLVHDFQMALELRDYLRREYPEDSHAAHCEVWAIYSV